MFSRIFSAACAVAMLAACAEVSPEPEGDTIDCAIGPGADFAAVCTLERVEGEGEGIFLIHSPDGAFRRLRIDPGSGEYGSVDGADALEVLEQDGQSATFSIAQDRYRIPHTMVRDGGE